MYCILFISICLLRLAKSTLSPWEIIFFTIISTQYNIHILRTSVIYIYFNICIQHTSIYNICYQPNCLKNTFPKNFLSFFSFISSKISFFRILKYNLQKNSLSNIKHKQWYTGKCNSCILNVSFSGTLITTSERFANFPPPSPVKPITFIPFAFATMAAFKIFFEFPDVEIPKKTSSAVP